MTIGIGVLCSTKPHPHTPRPDSLVMIADTMGSTDTDSTEDLHKMFINESLGFYAVAAGVLERAADLIPNIQREVAGLTKRTHGGFLAALSKAANEHRAQHFAYEIVAPQHMLRYGQIDKDRFDEVMRDFRAYDTGMVLLLGIFDDDKRAYLYHVGGTGLVHTLAFPGHYCIGSGAANAEMWLNFRRQTLGSNLTRSAYHAYEAKRMAARAPTVNDDIEILIATATGPFQLTRKEPEKHGCAVSLTELDQLWEAYKPRDTSALGLSSTSTSARS